MRSQTIGWLLGIVPFVLAPALASERDALLAARREQLKQKWEQQFRAADADQDRSLSLAEARSGGLPPALTEHFAKIDANSDGGLTPEELLDAYEKRLKAQAPARSGPPR